MKSKYFFLCLFLTALTELARGQDGADTRLPCRLEWIPFSAGNSVPANAMRAQGHGSDQTEQLIIRDLNKTVGRYDVEAQLAYLPIVGENNTAVIPLAFELLTNPHGCLTVWSNMDFRFRVNSGLASEFVGRTQYDPHSSYGQWYCGRIIGSKIQIAAPNEDRTAIVVVEKTSEYQYLISYSTGLLLTIEDFIFDEGAFGSNPDFMSQDEIHNESPSMVSQIITHEKRIRERLEITITVTTVSRNTTKVKKNMIINSKKTEETHTYTRTESRTYITETETNVTASLDLMVPPFTSVKACSLVEVSEGKDIEYEAMGFYTAPGMTPQEVYDLVRVEYLPGLEFRDALVTVPITGKLTVNLAMTTRFLVSPADSAEDQCSVVKRNSFKTSDHFK